MADNNDEQNITSSITNLIREESVDVFQAVSIDQNRIRAIGQSIMTLAINSSPFQQFGMGLGIGWVSGYLFKRVSRTAAFLIGCGFLAIQGATALGVITVNTQRLQQIADNNMRRIRAMSGNIEDDDDNSLYQRLIHLSNQHMYLSSGFISGAVIAFTF